MSKPERTIDFFAKRASGWEDFVKKEWLPNEYEHYYTILASAIPQTEDAVRILDLGCGGGIEFEWILRRAPNACITAVDQSGPMLDCLRKKYADFLRQFELVQDSYLTCRLEINSYDFVVTSMSVHYFPPEKRLEIYRRVFDALKPHGVYIEGTYCSNSPAEERKTLEEFRQRTAELDGSDTGEWKVNVPLQAATISKLLGDAGFTENQWLAGEKWVVTALKPTSQSTESSGNQVALRELSKPDRRRLLAELAEASLEAFGLRGGSFSLLQDHVNTSFRVHCADSEWYLRIYNPDRHCTCTIESELLYLELLADTGFPCPRPLCTQGNNRVWVAPANQVSDPIRVSVCSWLKGNVLQNDKTTEHFIAVGSILADLHKFSSKWDAPSGFSRPRCDAEGVYGNHGSSGDEVAQAWRNITEPLRSDLQKARALLQTSEKAIGKTPNSYGLLHADPSFGNVLFDNNAPSLIDFDDLAYGYYVFDLAVVLAGAWGKPGYAENRGALLASYTEKRHLTDAELAAVPAAMAARAATLIFWAAAQASDHPWINGQWERLKEYLEC